MQGEELSNLLGELLQLARSQHEEIAAVKQKLARQGLGFRATTHVRRVHCNAQYAQPSGEGCMYFWNGATKTPELIPQRAICVVVLGIKAEPQQYKGKIYHQVELLVDAGEERYKMMMAIDSSTAKGCMRGLLLADLESPVTLYFEQGTDDPNVLLCNVYQNSKLLYEEGKLSSITDQQCWAMLNQLQDKLPASLEGQEMEADEPIPPVPSSPVQSSPAKQSSQSGPTRQSRPVSPAKQSSQSGPTRQSRPVSPAVQPSSAAVAVQDLGDMIVEIDVLLQQHGISVEIAKQYILTHFNKRTRSQLTEAEMLSLLNHLRGLAKKTEDDWN